MTFKTLYKRTVTGQIQQWRIIAQDNFYYTVEGIKDGALTVSASTECFTKNKGKKNEILADEQAVKEATAKYNKKLKEGYVEDISKIDEVTFFKPMLAQKYEDYTKLLFTVPTYIQPKLDGVRCYLNNKTLTTREGNRIMSCPHLEVSLQGIDGELYSHSLKDDFNKIISLVKKTKPTDEDIKEAAEKIEFWVYDYPAHDGVFVERYAALVELINKHTDVSFRLVPTYKVDSIEEINVYHESFIKQGFEGSMIRLDLKPYENKRSTQLLKKKDWLDDEFEILDIIEGKGNRKYTAGNLVVQLPDNKVCDVSMTGTHQFMHKVLKDKDKLIGKKATVKYFGYTPAGKLRFPTFVAIRDYE